MWLVLKIHPFSALRQLKWWQRIFFGFKIVCVCDLLWVVKWIKDNNTDKLIQKRRVLAFS